MIELIGLTFVAALLSMPIYSSVHALLRKNSRARHFWRPRFGDEGLAILMWFFAAGVFSFSLALSYGQLPNTLLGPISGAMMYLSIYVGFGFYDASQDKWENFLPSSLKNWLVSNRQAAFKQWAELHPIEIAEAKVISKKMLKMLKGKKQREQFTAVSSKLQKLVEHEIPRLLANEKLLAGLVIDAQATIKAEKANGIIEGEQQLMADSEKDLATLKKRLEDTRNKIQLILCFLNHFSIRVSVLISADSTAEVEQSLFEVQQDLDQMLRADEEIAELHAKYVHQEISARKAADAEVDQVIEKVRQPRNAVAE